MSGKFDMSDYVTVPERIVEFREKYPLGSLQSEIVELLSGPDRVTVKAFAFRTPDDPRPGIGHSSLAIPGKTPYTKDSEIENAETSAWGRAIVAALAADTKRGIASQDEIRKSDSAQGTPNGGAVSGGAAAPERHSAPKAAAPESIVGQITDKQLAEISELIPAVAELRDTEPDKVRDALISDIGGPVENWSQVEAAQMIGKLKRWKSSLSKQKAAV